MDKEFNWRDEVPDAWVPLIEADEWLRESFDEFSDEYEPAPLSARNRIVVTI